jgi:hypothetical protein
VAAAAATTGPDILLGERSVTVAPGVARPWEPQIVIPARTSTASATGNPTVRSARKLPICRMGATVPTLISGNLWEKDVINSSPPT